VEVNEESISRDLQASAAAFTVCKTVLLLLGIATARGVGSEPPADAYLVKACEPSEGRRPTKRMFVRRRRITACPIM
jgi:hypothetical protein